MTYILPGLRASKIPGTIHYQDHLVGSFVAARSDILL